MFEIIPAIDLIEGKAVRLTQGDFAAQKIYSENPVDVAKQFAEIGLRRLHVVDLDGAKTGKIANLAVLERIAAATDLDIDFGGGVKTFEDAVSVFDAGAKILTVGSVAAKEPETFENWLNHFGGERILLGADIKNGFLAINGWQTATQIELISFLRGWFAKGVRQAFVTDISRDGLLQGAATEIYQKIHGELPELNLIASGGVSRIEDFAELEQTGCFGAIVGKAIYEGKITFEELRKFISKNK